MNKAIFLDRDGVINKMLYHDEKGIYSARNLDEFEVLSGVKKGISDLKKIGFKIIVVSNQPGVAFGYIKEHDLEKINQYMKDKLKVDWVYNCVHHPDHTGECSCRKPKPGMLKTAAEEHGLDLKKSFIIGDNLSDIQAGKECNKTIMISKVNCSLCNIMHEKKIKPDFIVKNFSEAVDIIKIGGDLK
ncbi:HAD-IIIA family hydrolase [Candidatus Woesearchaeota archaeon]|nr:HAD-IIIA family hydrolase [Candidatus Woesearchaeota archaeon]